MHTTLTIERHADIAEKELGDFLYRKYPSITMDTIKTIYCSLSDFLTRKQSYERLPSNACFNDVKYNKGFSKADFSNLIDKAIILSVPPFDEVLKYSGVNISSKNSISLNYIQILTDSNNALNESFANLHKIVLSTIENTSFNTNETSWEYGQRIGKIIHIQNPIYKIPYSLDYISVLTICILINQSRRKP